MLVKNCDIIRVHESDSDNNAANCDVNNGPTTADAFHATETFMLTC